MGYIKSKELELYEDTQIYLAKINKEPSVDMIKDGQGYHYIPKSILQRELSRIYDGQIKWEMEREQVTAKGMWAVGRLHVRLPYNGEWIFFSGTASLPIAKGMRLDFPRLEAQCFKNACKKIGPWFGQCLNLDVEDAEPEVTEQEEEEVDEKNEAKLTRLRALIEAAKTIEELAGYKKDIDKEGFGKVLTKEYMSKVKELTK